MGVKPAALLTLLAALELLDRAAKVGARAGWSWRPSERVGFWLTENRGIAFSLPVPSGLATALIAIVLVALVALGVRRWSHHQSWAPLALLVTGGASNLFDRLALGSVTDYVHLGPWPVFNLADLLVAAGLILLAREGLTRRSTIR